VLRTEKPPAGVVRGARGGLAGSTNCLEPRAAGETSSAGVGALDIVTEIGVREGTVDSILGERIGLAGRIGDDQNQAPGNSPWSVDNGGPGTVVTANGEGDAVIGAWEGWQNSAEQSAVVSPAPPPAP